MKKRVFGILLSLALMLGMMAALSATAYATDDSGTISVTLNYGSGHTGLFSDGVTDGLKAAVGAEDAWMAPFDTTIILEFSNTTEKTEAGLYSDIVAFVRSLKGAADWLIDEGYLYGGLGYKPFDKYETAQELMTDRDPDNPAHKVQISNGLTYYLLWGEPFEEVTLDNGNPVCGRDAASAAPTLPAGIKYYENPDDPDDAGHIWKDADDKEAESFEGGKEYKCTVLMNVDMNSEYWRYFFNEDNLKVNVTGGEVEYVDVDTPGLLIVRFKAAADHDWDEGKVTKEPTTTGEGEKLFKCKHCTATKTEAIPRVTDTTPVGSIHNVGGSNYVVTSANTVSLVKAASRKSFTLPAAVTIDGKTFHVTGMNAKSFKDTKATALVVKTRNLTKKSVKGSLRGSKVKTVKVKVGKKKENKKFVKKYKKIFTKKNAGKKVRVKK